MNVFKYEDALIIGNEYVFTGIKPEYEIKKGSWLLIADVACQVIAIEIFRKFLDDGGPERIGIKVRPMPEQWRNIRIISTTNEFTVYPESPSGP